MVKRYGPSLALCLFFLVAGILIGGAIVAANPGPNHIHMTVMPNQKVYLSPETGDIVNWVPFDPSSTLGIFFQGGERPCNEVNASSVCTVNTDGLFFYTCIGDAHLP